MEHYKEGASTIIELLIWRANNQPDKVAYQFLDNGETEGARYTYGDLDRRARSVAAQLQKITSKGDRVILVFDNDLEYIAIFYACLYAGIISAPLHPPGRNKSMFRISSVTKDAEAKIILTTSVLKNKLKDTFSADPVLKDLNWIATDEITNDFANEWTDPNIKNDDIAFLQYTSGSTGSPKGVMVTHDNLLYNIYGTIYRYNLSELDPKRNDSLVTWAPLFHDLGLIFCTLLPLYGGFPCYMMTPEAFIQRPIRWLETVSKYRSTIGGAPNFAYELLINRVSKEEVKTLDLSSFDIAMNGSEPVRAETLAKFAEHFAPAGFKPHYFSSAWGQAETTIIITTTEKDKPPVVRNFDKEELEKDRVKEIDINGAGGLKLVGHTMNLLDAKSIIVHPKTLTLCKENEVGEVWVSGSTVTPGYFNKPKANKETFQAYTKDTREGPFLRTGDLGFIQGDQLFITGRYKDLIIIRGQNHYPQDIEITVERSHPALRLGCEAAFSVEAEGEEQLILVQEINKKFADNFDPDEVCKAIRKAVSEEHNLNVYHILLLKTGTVRKTSSGKIQRNDNKHSYLEGTLSVLAEWRQGMGKAEFINSEIKSADIKTDSEVKEDVHLNLKDWLVNKASELMKIQPGLLDTNESFASYGMDSLRAVQFSGEISAYLKKQLPATLVYNYPSVNLLLKYLEKDSGPKESAAEESVSSKNIINQNEPIAVIGMACRFPGAENTDEFWNMLSNGKNAIRDFPSGDRWKKDYVDDDKTITFGGYLDDIDKFDPQFFGISPREATQMDPQQRLLLEVSWEALENACIDPGTLKGKNAGVFMGVCSYDYARFSVGEKSLFDVYTGTGTSLSIVANRLSYLLDLRGPSVAIDTACSSSLVAIHQACSSLRNGETSIAITGGVSLILSSDTNTIFTQTGFLSEDGKCKTFDADANGYVRGEGCGVLILKPLLKAIEDGDRVLALIKGSAVNQDGKSNGLTAPNGLSQEDVIRTALANSSAAASEITYIEAHGTGTPLGDPIEVNSIKEVLNTERSKDNKLYIGSVKTNIGHLEGAAGVAGIIKTILSLQHKVIPKHLNFKKLNAEILIDGTPIEVASEKTKWKGNPDGRRLAGVSSFGFGGTNAHIILEEAPEVTNDSVKGRANHLFTLSAKSENGLQLYADIYEEFLKANIELNPEDICYSANAGRASLGNRLAIVTTSTEDLITKLKEYSAGAESADIIRGVARLNHRPKIAFLFPGQGAQYIGMGKELYDTHPLFRKIINQCDEILRSYLEKSLLEVLFYEKDEKLNPINETTYTQPALFAVEYALGKLWMSWGVYPDVMMGHSAGEYVAACLAGVFSLEDGLKLTAERGRLMQTMTSDGEMYTVFENETEVKKALKGFEENVSVASINSPVKTVISGNKDSLSKILPYFDSKQIEYKKINVSIASHSPLMIPMINEFRKVCSKVKYSNAKIPIVSNITAEIVTDKISNPDYWCEHIMSSVRFSDSIKECVKSGIDIFIDLGSMPTSIGMAQETIQDPDIKWIASIKKNFTVWETMLQGLGTLYVNGFEPDWECFGKNFSHKKTGLPTYPFQRQRYWIEDLKSKSIHSDSSFKKKSGSSLLGRKLSLADSKEIIFNNYLSSDNPAFIREHGIYGRPVFPTTAYVELAMEAGKEILGTKDLMIEDLLLHNAFLFEEDTLYNVQIILKETEGRMYSFEIYSCKVAEDNNGIVESEWTKNVSGKIFRSKNPEISKDGQSKLTSEQMTEIEPDDFYEKTFAYGIEYSGSFRMVSELSVNGSLAFANIKASAETEEQFKDYIFHPVLLDACLHTAFAPLLNQMNPELIYLPIGIGSVCVYGKAEGEVRCFLEYDSLDESKGILNANLTVYSAEGSLTAVVSDIQMKKVTKKDFIESTQNYLNDWLYEVKWENEDLESATSETYTFPATAGIKKYIDATLPGYIDEDHLALYRKALDRVELLCSEYIIKAFDELGYRFEVNSSFRSDELMKKLNVVKQHHKLFGRLLEILSEERYIEKYDGGWKILKTQKADSIAARLEKLKIQGIDAGAEMNLLVKCGSVLSEILSGKTDPLQLLFPEGDFEALTDLYEKSPAFRTMNNILKDAVSQTLENIPEGTEVRILEIGAGTGATTSYVLKRLMNKNVEYVFTDVSQLFLSRAKEKFSEYSNIVYRILDLEKDPAGQNFDEKSFDIIIASNVIHATKDLKQSLNNVKKLLKNNGRLIFTEATQKQKWVDLVFGLTEGWWRFEDNGLRKDHALLDETGWIGLLKESGFNEAEVVSVADTKKGSLTSQSVIIADMSRATGSQYMIIAEENEFSNLLKSEIESKGNACEMITPGRFYSEGFQEKKGSVIPEGIILLLDSKEATLTDDSENDIEDKDIEKLTGQACENVLNFVQNISKSGFTKIPKLVVVTKKAQPVKENDKINGLAFSTVGGLGKVISIEYPELNCIRIDVDSYDTANSRNILKELDSTFNEGEIAFRNGERFVSRLERSTPAAAKDIRIDPNGTYLITGGTKGLGLLFAKYLADKGAQHLVLLSRNKPEGENDKLIKDMKASGVDVKIVSADVTLKKELEKTITDINASGHLLKGIIHSAGLLDDGVMANQNREKFDRVLAPKILGSWYLSELTKDSELDFFIMFSSIASVLGSAGQSNHSAANSFLDSLAYYRRSRGLPATTINWGVWTGIGSAADLGADKQEKIAGLKVITPELGIRLFDKIFSKDYVRVGAFNVDWKRFEEKNYSKQMSVFVSELLKQEEKDIDGINEKKTGVKKVNILDEIRNAPAEDHNKLLTTYFQKLISGILGLKDTGIDAETPLNAIGLDSLMAIELKNKVNMELGVDLNLVRYMEDTNIIKLAEELREHLTKKLNTGVMSNGSDKKLKHEISEEDRARDLLDNLENMSEEEIERLLNENS